MSQKQTFEFIGSYPPIIRDLIIAGAVSSQNVLLVGPPGCAKTAIAIRMAQRMLDDPKGNADGKKWVMTRIDPSTSADEIAGIPNPATILDADNPRFERVLEGTPYEEGVSMWIPDEVGRGSDPLFDKMLQTLDMGKVRGNGDFPVAVGTTNFIPTDARVEALFDRFAMTFYIVPGRLPMRKLVEVSLMSGGKPEVPGTVPTWDEIEEIRSWPIDPQGMKAVQDVLDELGTAAEKDGRPANGRRGDQWAHILYRFTCYVTGRNDFSTVPDEARKILRYCYPATSQQEASEWRRIVDSVMDKVGAAIDRNLSMAVQEFRRVAAIPLDDDSRGDEVLKLGKIMSKVQSSLRVYEPDPRVAEAQQYVTSWFAAASMGQKELISYDADA